MKICTVLGARPQFIKAAALSRVLRLGNQEIIIHTGQHYDENMSEVFFKDLLIPEPDYSLGICGGTHGQMTGAMLSAVEEILMLERPDMCLVYGDTNSTLAGALAAVKLRIPVAHVEAGIRVGLYCGPEEVNRVVTDRISQLLFCCTQRAVENLAREGISEGVHNTGDVMYDSFLFYAKCDTRPVLRGFNGEKISIPKEYYLLTIHRPENTGNKKPLYEILSAMNSLDARVIFPVHPRTRRLAESICDSFHFGNIILTQPVGYMSSVYLTIHAKKIVTDSGGLQREAWFANVQCITILEYNGWPETMGGHMNQLCPPQKNEILKRLMVVPDKSRKENQFGDGHASERIAEIISSWTI